VIVRAAGKTRVDDWVIRSHVAIATVDEEVDKLPVRVLAVRRSRAERGDDEYAHQDATPTEEHL
jgi:hypothetical protein